MRRTRRPGGPTASRRVLGALVAATVVAVSAAVASSQEAAELPDSFEGATASAGLSIVSFKQPNPLPVGPGAFITYEMPEVAGRLTTSSATARTSLIYPGPLVVGMTALLCLAGAEPFCGQPPPPVVAEAEYPNKPNAALASDGLQISEPSSPLTTGAGNGTAATTAQSSTSTAKLGRFRVEAPDEMRESVLEALAQTLAAFPGGAPVRDTSLLSIGGGTSTQTIAPAGNGIIRAEAHTLLNDVKLLAGAISIDSISVHSVVLSNGDGVQQAMSSTQTGDVLIGGFEGHIGPEGFVVNGSGDDGQLRDGLNGIAAQVSDAVNMAIDKLDIEIRDGAASRTPDGTSAAADGLVIRVSNRELTDTSPPQVSALCTVTDVVSDGFASQGLLLPPICAVPDVTGTKDSYAVVLGKASAVLAAQLFPDFDTPIDPGTGLANDFGDEAPGGVGSGPSVGDDPGDFGSGAPDVRSPRNPVNIGQPSFLALEDRWLGGRRAANRFEDVYFAMLVLGAGLLAASRFVLRSARIRTKGSP